MLCYEENSDTFEAIENFYNKDFRDETIIEISGMFDDGYAGVYPGEQYCGIKLKTQNHVICAYIDPKRHCCERYGSILSQDNVADFVGSELKKVYLTNTADKTEYVDYIRSLRSTSTDYYNIQFINFETSKGLFQLTVYNCDNGYYGHDIVIKIDENIEYKKTVCGDMVWEEERNKEHKSLHNRLLELYPNAKEDDVSALCEDLWEIVCNSRKKLSLVESYIEDFELNLFDSENFEVTYNGEKAQLRSKESKYYAVLEKVLELLSDYNSNAMRIYQLIIDGNSCPFAINKLIKGYGKSFLTSVEIEKVISIARQYKPGTFEWLKNN